MPLWCTYLLTLARLIAPQVTNNKYLANKTHLTDKTPQVNYYCQPHKFCPAAQYLIAGRGIFDTMLHGLAF